ncbi:MAG: mandelate racemase/muconate lactonizing enzyme family protein [Granulosicoccus sp.]|nr:mandelate racemase/muconate lactonizing enzyme family protein [Granulosicoccus sp.]
MKITHAELVRFEPRFAGGKAYVQSIAVQTKLYHSLLLITTEDGLTGTGEVVRFSDVREEEADRMDVVTVKELIGIELSDIPRLLADWNGRDRRYRSISFALDCAWYDLLSQKSGLPVSTLLGGPAVGDVPEIFSLSAASVEETVASIFANDGQAPVIQIKLGVDDLNTDMTCVREVLTVLRPNQLVLADFNGALNLDTALKTIPTLSNPQLIWEDPCKAYEDNVKVAQALPSPMMIDSSLWGLDMISRAIADGVQVVCIKPVKFGGLGVARAARDMCLAAGMRIRIDGPWAGQHYAHAALALAIGAPADQMIGSIDLTEPLETDHEMIARPAPGRVGPAH